MNLLELIRDTMPPKKAKAQAAAKTPEELRAVLIKACNEGNLNKVKIAVEAGADVNAKERGVSILYTAVQKRGNDDIVRYLISKGADVNAMNGHKGMSALSIACVAGLLGIIKILKDAGANVNQKSYYDESPLYFATSTGIESVVRFLIENGANIDDTNYNEKTTAFYEACKSDFLGIANILADAGADINKKNAKLVSPLMIAVYTNRERIVKFLLNKGVSIDDVDLHGQSALFIGCKTASFEIIKMLVEAGANIYLKSNTGETPLDIARYFGKHDVVTYLESLMQPQVEKPKWKGFSRSDISKFDTIFGDDAINFAVCPVCLKYVERSDACMYMRHNCAALGGFYHHDLYNKYKNTAGQVGWCTICGRVCVGHNHYELGLAKDAKPTVIVTAHDPFSKDCRDANGGGGLPEKFSRFRRMREFALELNEFVGSMTEEDALKELIEETWNAPLNRSLRIPKIMTDRKWNIPTNAFPENSAPVSAPKANANDPTKYKAPLVLIPGDVDYKGNDYAADYESPVMVFTHKSATGADHTHPQISKEMLLDMLDAAGEKQGKCFDDTCGGLLWPKEIQLAFDDPKMAPTVTDADRERLRKYKERFNGWHAPTGGGRRRKTVRRRH